MSCRIRAKSAALLLIAVVGTVVCGIACSSAGSESEIPDYRYVLVQPDRAAGELERANGGAYRVLPRSEFEALYDKARAIESGRGSPQLVVANYRARLDDVSLSGDARWTVRNSQTDERLLPIEPLSVAVRSARWTDGRTARVGQFVPAGGLQLLVDRSGDSTLDWAWSARGYPEPTGSRFDLRFPRCAVSMLELDLPADRQLLLTGGGALLSGPSTGAGPQRRIWRIAFAGDNLGDLRVAPADKPEPLLLAAVDARQDVQLEQTQCEFRFDLEVVHGPLTSLTMECTPGFIPTEVVVRNLARWTTQDATQQIVVEWSEPFSGGTLVVRGFVAHRGHSEWTSPGVTPIGAVVPSEKMTLHAGPSVRLNHVRPGSFQLTGGAASNDRGQTIVANAGPVRTGNGRIRARLSEVHEPMRLLERTWWQADASPPRATVQMTLEPRAGLVNRSTWWLPPGWTVTAIESTPADILGGWRAVADADWGQLLIVDWARAIQSGRPAALVVRMIHDGRERGSRRIWPNLRPMAPAARTGILALRSERGWKAAPIGESVRELSADEKAVMPNDIHLPDAVVPLSAVENRWSLDFEPTKAPFDANVSCHVEFAAGLAHMTCRLAVDAGENPLHAIALRQCDPRAAGIAWEDPRDKSTVRATEFPAVEALALAAAAAAGSPWNCFGELARQPACGLLLQLPQPAVGRTELIGRGTLPLPGDGGDLSPFAAFQVLGSSATRWKVTVDRRSAPMWRVLPAGAESCWADDNLHGIETFQIDGGAGAIAIVPANSPRLMDPRLSVDASEMNRIVYRAQVDVCQWNQRTLTVQLPVGAELVSAAIAGRAVANPAVGKAKDGTPTVTLPAPPADQWTLEINYSKARSEHGLFNRIPICIPTIAGLTTPFSIQIATPSGWMPVSTGWRSIAAESELHHSWAIDGNDIAGTADPAIALVRSSAAWAIVLAVSGIWLTMGLAKFSWIRPFSIAMGIGLAAILATWESPSTALLVAPLVACMAAVIAPSLKFPAPASRTGINLFLRPAGLILIIGGICLGGLHVTAAPPVSLVLLIRDPDGKAERDTVLMPREFEEKLRETIRRSEPATSGTVVDARYDGRVVGNAVEFKATWQVLCPGESTRFTIPFRGAVLSRITVDGALGLPTVEQESIAILIRGRGLHDVEMVFSTPIQQRGMHSVRFPIIESAQCRLTFQALTGTTNMQALSCRGRQNMESIPDGPRLEADLGPVKSVHLNWMPASDDQKKRVRAREAYLWDVSDSGARLLGELACQFDHPAESIDIELPAGVEVYFVRAEPDERGDAAEAGPWLANWTVQTDGSERRLRLHFSSPAPGSWTIRCEFRPTTPLTATGLLAFPSIRDARVAPAFCAWRTKGQAAVVTATADFQPVSAEAMSQVVSTTAGWDLSARPVLNAYVRDRPDTTAALRIRPSPSRLNAESDLAWTVGPSNVAAEWSGKINSTGGPIVLLEWDVPSGVTVKEFRGDDVALWSRTGARLQVWMKKPVTETIVAWTGSIARSRDGRFDMPVVRFLRGTGTATVRVAARPGLILAPIEVQRLEALADTGHGGRNWDYRVTGANPRGQFQVRDALGTTDFQLRTAIDRTQSGIQATTSIDATVRRGALSALVLRAENAADAEFVINASGAIVTEGQRSPGSKVWFVDYPREIVGTVHIEVRAVGAAHAGRRWSIPNISVATESNRRCRVRHSLSLAGERLTVAETAGLTLAGKQWQPGAGPWRMIVADLTEVAPKQPPRVRFIEHAACAQDHTWVRALTARVESGAGQSLAVVWQSPVDVVLAEIDGKVYLACQGLTSRLMLPPDPEGARTLRIVWRSPIDGPKLISSLPRIESSAGRLLADQTLLTVTPPLGQSANISGTPLSRADAAARRQSAGVSPSTAMRQFDNSTTTTWIIDNSMELPFAEFSEASSEPTRKWRQVAAILIISSAAWFAGLFSRRAPCWQPIAVMAACGWLATGGVAWLAAPAACALAAVLAGALRWFRSFWSAGISPA